MTQYDHKKIEKKWQEIWEKAGTFKAVDDSTKPKYYALIEFPYPSGDGLHVGHPRPYIGMDVIARKRRLEGFNVLYPIGWDAFGLPTENYAIKTGKDPREVTRENTDIFRRQIKSLGISFDWSRELNTTDPKYYKWTQWIFLQLFKHGLAYKAKTTVNWCPKDKIVLANEEVVNGKCERCGSGVEKREKEQWMLAITKYADRLDKDLDEVDYLPQIKLQQRNWIGRSEGAEINFLLDFKKNPKNNERRGPNGERAQIPVFTTRPDTIFGATYLVLSPEHLWVTLATDDEHDVLLNKEEVKKYVEAARIRTDIERTAENKEKTGVEIKGVKAINPATGEEIPMFVADYVLAHYGTGAIMAVPAHDDRDFDFAKKYDLPIREVILPETGIPQKNPEFRKSIVAILRNTDKNIFLSINWSGLGGNLFIGGGREGDEDVIECAKREIAEETGYINVKFIKKTSIIYHNYFAHSKNVARRIEVEALLFDLVDDKRNNSKLEENEQEKFTTEWLPSSEIDSTIKDELHRTAYRLLVEDKPYIGKGILINSGKFDGQSSTEVQKEITEFVGGKMKTTYKLRDWVFSRQRYWGEPIPIIHCPACAKASAGKPNAGYIPVAEKDLPVELPVVKNYQPTDTGESPLATISDWVNVKCPKCGGDAKRETDTMPNWAGSSWYFLRYIDPKNDELLASSALLKHWMPIDWYNGGMEHVTLHLLYSRFWNKFLYDIKVVPTSEPYLKRTAHGFILAPDGEKMSKSRANVINPDDIVETYGADTLRLYEMFLGPFDQTVVWSTDSIIGPRRFLEKVWRISEKVSDTPSDQKLQSLVHQTIKKVTEDIEAMRFNTAVSTLMILANQFENATTVNQDDFNNFLILLSVFCPHIAEELWQMKGAKNSIQAATWPVYDPSLIAKTEVTIVIQINGKTRSRLTAAAGSVEEEIVKLAMELPEANKWLDGALIKKTIFVKDKLINFVI